MNIKFYCEQKLKYINFMTFFVIIITHYIGMTAY